jgi:hypothetical protein
MKNPPTWNSFEIFRIGETELPNLLRRLFARMTATTRPQQSN